MTNTWSFVGSSLSIVAEPTAFAPSVPSPGSVC